MEKYGFVYLWRDKKHKRYYVGCHWGTEDDGYICSSHWMRRSFKNRPGDFKRRIIAKCSTRVELFNEEYKFLCMIDKCMLGTKYYNLSVNPPHHWSIQEDSRGIRKKISDTMKAKHHDPEYRKMYEETHSTDHLRTPEVQQKRTESILKAWEIRSPEDQRYIASIKGSEEHKQKLSEASLKRWSQPDARERQAKITSEFHKGKQHRLGHKNTPEQNAKISVSNTGQKRSNETRAKQSEAAKRRKATPEQKLARSIKTKEMWARRKANITLVSINS